jgi:hypothetical protein
MWFMCISIVFHFANKCFADKNSNSAYRLARYNFFICIACCHWSGDDDDVVVVVVDIAVVVVVVDDGSW